MSKFKPILPNSLYCASCTHLSLCVKYNFPRSWGDRCRGGAKIPVGCTREEVAADLLLLEPKTPMLSKLQSLLHTTWPQLVRPCLPPVVLSSPSPVVHSLPSSTRVSSLASVPVASVVSSPPMTVPLSSLSALTPYDRSKCDSDCPLCERKFTNEKDSRKHER